MSEIRPDQNVKDFISEDDSSESFYSENITRDEEGRYYWVYEQPMLKSFFLLFEVWKVLAIAAVIVLVISLFFNLINGEGMEGVIGSFKVCLLVLGILFVLSLPAYYIVTKANNNKYTVLFEMDKEGVDHTQIKTEKALALEKLTMLVGAATGNRTAMSAGLLSATGGSLYSRFANVRKIKACPDKNLIKVDSRFIRNQIYAADEDFEFVYNYIVEHCPQAVIK
ncbi:MAG: hypothetical protein J6Z03_00390 [Erysipelotrichaceae bacterium]|nr:hypothetical protein [Erysipelotrichaceae bacterium]